MRQPWVSGARVRVTPSGGPLVGRFLVDRRDERRQWSASVLIGLACLQIALSRCVDGAKLRDAFDPCGGNACVAPSPGPQDCAALPNQDWAVEGYNLYPESQVTAGTTVKTYLAPDVEDHCSSTVTRVVWSVDDPAVASVLPAGGSAWVTGLRPGATEVGALVVFASGSQRRARPRLFRVVPAAGPAAGSAIVAKGDVALPPYVPPGTVDNWRGWITFTTGSAGRIDVVVDWESVLDHVDFAGFEGRCTAVGACGRLVLTVRHMNVKPLTETFDSPRMPGEYTLRIDNLGPGQETIRYEVRLTPS